MLRTTFEQRRQLEQMPRKDLRVLQLEKLNALLAAIVPHNPFYGQKLAHIDLPLPTLSDFQNLPFTFKDELFAAPSGEFAANLTYPIERYVRLHQTSGTRGRPHVVLDTAEDWQGWIDVWQFVLDAAEVTRYDRVLLAFSFGPFIGFWSAHDAAIARGSLVIPTGGMNSLARLEMIRNTRATVLLCTPSYALRLVEVADENQIDPTALSVRRIIVAGEPGGSVPAVRRRIETAWNARLIDHAGASEVGPWGYPHAAGHGLHVIESDFLPEFLSVETGGHADDGELAELVLTPLSRYGSPVIRYRTGDLVRPVHQGANNNNFVLLDGGVLGRADDMLIVRGVNIFPSSIEQIVRSFPEVVEFRVTARRSGTLDSLEVEVEDHLQAPGRISQELQLRLGLNVNVACVPLGSLPRFEGKGKRFIDLRQAPRAS